MSRPIAIRCDGGAATGAGHVSRCLPIALALRDLGVDVRFVGRYDGVAAWLVEHSGLVSEAPGTGPCGLDPPTWGGAVVDLYLPAAGEAAVCDLAAVMPTATVGEASRCPEAGLWIDYHAGSADRADERRLGGPRFAPLDPRFAAQRRERKALERVLVMAGASDRLGEAAGALADVVAKTLPYVQIVAPAATAAAASAPVASLPSPFDLAEVAADVDLAVVAAGMTAYELASAGIPVVAVSLVENQRIVVEGCRATGIALGVDGVDRDPRADVAAALRSLVNPEVRRRVAATAMRTLDGRGAERVANALLSAWGRPGTSSLGR